MAPYIGQIGVVVDAGKNLLPGFVAVAIESAHATNAMNPIPTIFHLDELQEAPQERTNND
jgi:hypothetical protein